ncbi:MULTISPECIES: hypothetical protein [unclassified Caballeronia]|uniref:hypothetical protein n=1 Tax=unclassified Caballeronia TaxID=2646786 RepID=UPI001F14EE96|nr:MULTISPECIES: hypothetical protein [unclassified Caballeronia]
MLQMSAAGGLRPACSGLKLGAHTAWSMEHGLATLILANRAPRVDTKVAMPKLIDLVVMMLLGAITAGPDHFPERDSAMRAPSEASGGYAHSSKARQSVVVVAVENAAPVTRPGISF